MTHQQKAAAQQAFLDSFQRIGVICRAAIDAGVSRRTVYNWLKNDEEFQNRFHLAEDDARDTIREEMHRRAVHGWDMPVYYQGELVGRIRKYSDGLLWRMAQARLPEYRSAGQHERQVETVGARDGVATEVIVEYVAVDGTRSVQRVSHDRQQHQRISSH